MKQKSFAQAVYDDKEMTTDQKRDWLIQCAETLETERSRAEARELLARLDRELESEFQRV